MAEQNINPACPTVRRERSRREILTSDRLAYYFFYLAILFFIIGFNFSDNRAGNWYQQFMPGLNGRNITDIYFLDSLTGWSVTNAANQNPDTTYVLKTTNGGDNWVIQYRKIQTGGGFSGYFRVYFLNQNTGYTCGVTGFDKTTNGGVNWLPVWTADTYVDMSILNIDTIWLVSSNSLTGGVYRTTNGGASWEQQLNLGSQNPDHIYMFNERIGFICETNNYIRKTTNGGQNWDTIVNGESFRDMYFVDSLKGWRAYGINMYKTTNGGINWILQILPSGGNIITTGIYEFSNVNADTMWGVGGEILIPPSQSRGIVYKSVNGGANWGFQIPDTSIHIPIYYYNKFINKLNGWAYFTTTGVHTFTGGGDTTYTFIQFPGNFIPSEFRLFQNYSNPFNPNTIIRFEIKRLTDLKLVVYDVTGKEVITIADKEYKGGIYEVIFDGSNYSSGVYFYSLYADGKLIDTKRMVLLK